MKFTSIISIGLLFKLLRKIFLVLSQEGLSKDDFTRGIEYEIMLVPNIVNITYGRGVGYVFEEEVFDQSITDISATKIRMKMREEGDL